MKRALTVTIGIPAYNEEANIRHLLLAVVIQKETNFIIKNICIVDDRSTDNTVKEIKMVNDTRIQLLKNQSRKGQVYSQNKIFARADTDVVVLFEADTALSNSSYIQTLVKPINNDRTIGLVQGNIAFARAQTFVGRVIREQAVIYHRTITRKKNIERIFSSGRGGRAFSRMVYAKLRWPAHVPEDTFAALWCIRKCIPIKVQKSAICLFRLPENITDFRRARQKMVTGRLALEKYFNLQDIQAIYGSGLKTTLPMFIKEFLLTNPLYCAVYGLLKVYAEIVGFNRYFTDFWEVGRSTKFMPMDGKSTLRKSVTISQNTQV